MLLQGSLSIERMCQLVPVSRRSFYRSLKERQPAEEELKVRSAIQQIALEHRRRYGYRRITAELHRRGMQINHKRVVRIMREDNLLANLGPIMALLSPFRERDVGATFSRQSVARSIYQRTQKF
jgi:transposase InsO family protein